MGIFSFFSKEKNETLDKGWMRYAVEHGCFDNRIVNHIFKDDLVPYLQRFIEIN